MDHYAFTLLGMQRAEEETETGRGCSLTAFQ